MRSEVAWPHISDLQSGGALFPYVRRCAGAALIALLLWWWGWHPVPLVLMALASFRFLPGKLGRYEAPPGAAQQGGFCTPAGESAPWDQLNGVLLLGAIAGPLNNLLLLLAFGPFIAYRLGSKLWTELDLEHGRVLYHRMFFGLQITREGVDLEEGSAVHSAIRVERPGHDVSYAVAIATADGRKLTVRSDAASTEASRVMGLQLARQLDLPHYTGEQDSPDEEWPLLDNPSHKAHSVLPWDLL